MGGSQSSERVSISREREDEAFNIVRVSEDAIRTLRGERNFGSVANVDVPTKPVSVDDEKFKTALNDEKLLTQRLRQDLLQRQHEINELSKKLTLLERESKESALSVVAGDTEKVQQAETFYRQKLQELLERERRRQEESTKQFKDSLERLQQRFLKYSCHTACADVESKVLQCYLQNPQQPLRCWQEGDEFIQCVDEYRAKMLTAKEMRVSAN